MTKSASSQTNGICERFHKTIFQELNKVAFRGGLPDIEMAAKDDHLG